MMLTASVKLGEYIESIKIPQRKRVKTLSGEERAN